MNDTGWRKKPLARAIVISNCWLLIVSASAPLYAAPPAVNALPQAANILVNANQGAATVNTVGNTMTVNQGSNKVILNWKSFDIGKDGKVQFVQPSAQAIALNKIGDSAASQIFGQLGANGTIYLVNNNGIIFGQGSQVNVHSLLASTLNIDANQFMNSSILNAINDNKAALEGGSAANASIIVEAGAKISTDGNSGQILMFAPNVINNGEIRSPDGQTILAASQDRVYLTASDKDQDLRGILVEVDTGGNVTNVGQIVAERGNITLLGLAVNQSGRLTATTSVDVNGSIRLLARDTVSLKDTVNEKNDKTTKSLLLDDPSELPSSSHIAVATHSGTVTIGNNSTTEVIADSSSGTAADAQPQNKSRIDVMGKTIAVNSGAVVSAKSGKINLTATATPDDPESPIARNDSRLLIDSNATLDVSGENVELPMERRVVAVELRGDELKDSPLQRNGVLRGKTVNVDIATGTPLVADLSPTLAKIQKGVKERMVEGGTINLHSQGDVAFNDNATLNTAGGSITYAAGLINTTKLMTSDGRVVDIGKADPNQRYAGIFGEHSVTHFKWGKTDYGQTSALTLGTYYNSFTEGKNAGSLNIAAQALQGFDRANIQAGMQRGPTQRDITTGPAGGTVNIVLGYADKANNSIGAIQNAVIDQVGHSQAIALSDSLAPNNGELPLAYFSADKLNASGVSSFSLTSNGHIDVNENTNVRLTAGSKFALTGTSLDFNGTVRSAAGAVVLKTAAPSSAIDDAQPLTLGARSVIDVGGAWNNDALDLKNANPLAILALNGGSIDIGARGNLTVASGARLNANAGAQLTSAGVFKGGSGGNIAFTTNAGSNSDTGSRLILNGAYSAYGFGNGGKLALEANGFQIGGASNDARIVQIDPAFFARGGFSDYSLKSNLIGIDIAPQTQIAPQQQNFVVKDFNRLTTIASGGDIGSVLQLQTLPDYNRNPVSLHLNAAQAVARTTDLSAPAYLRVGSQAQINADNGATVDLISVGSIAVDGAIHARGGKINLTIEDPATGASIDRGYSATQAIWLGNHALLDAAATVERALDPTQQLIDKVFDAGAINIAAKRGFIAAAPGSVMDVSGAAYLVNLPRNAIERAGQRSVTVNAAAGAINLTAADGIAAYSTFNGHGSGDGLAGSINFTLDGGLRNEGTQASTFAFFPLEISVGENLPNWDGAIQAGSALPNTLRGKALIAADSLRSGGFGSLSLATSNRPSVNNGAVLNDYGRISFNSDVALALSDRLTLSATNINIANHNVDLSAAIVNIGRDGGQSPKSVFQNLEQTAAGTGQFNLSGKFIDVVGNVGISGAAATQLSSATDLRFRNVIDANNLKQLAAAQFTTPGDLTLRAAQIYPSTMSDYTVRLTGTDSTLTTALPAGGGTRTPILSAGGKLALMAPNIEHGGNLVAPLGTIELDATNSIHLAAGSNIDVSSNVLIPYGRLLGSDLYWTYPIVDGQPLIIDKVPQKSVVLNAPSTKMDSGATVNLSGGGDIYAFEQIPGPGGSKDFLAAENANGAFAVVPWLSSLATPFDTVEMQGFNIALGTTIWLDGANGLPAGNYAVLPAHYALLDGAYLITPKGSALPGVVAKGTAIDGTAIVTGRFGRGMSGQYASQWQSFSVETGAAARLRSEYKESTGAEFFKDDAVDLAADAGHMLISAQTALELNGTINAAAQNGRGAQLDIIADKIAVVADLAQDVGTGVVKLAASALNHLGVDSLMLGGTRTRAGDDTNVDVRSSDITVGSGAQLQAPDIILAARDHIAVQANASVQGSGTSTVNTRAFIIDGDGALLRASSAAQSNVQRSNSSGSAGDLQIATTAQLGADKSLLLDATRTMTLPNTIGLDNGSLNISANRISLGDVPAATTGVAFSNAQLNALNAQELRFSSRSSIDFFGSVNFQNRTTTLNTGALRSMQAGDARISATDTLQLQNGVNGAGSSGNADGGGNLILTAKNIVLGSEKDTASTLALDGFNAVQLGEAGQTASLRGAGEFSLLAPALTIYADNIGAASAGAKINLLASGAVALNKANAAASTSIPANNPPLGAELTIEGASIRHDTAINLPSGIVSMTATGTQATDDVALGSNANIDVSGATIALQHANINTAGGTVNLISNNASVRAEFGSSVNISGAKESGNAGTLNILAAQGSATWSGALVAQAAGSASGGNLSVDAKALDANSLITTASSAGATNSLILRARTGDIVVNEDVHAQKINISADGSNIDSPRDGALTVNSTLDASGANGGSIALYSHDDLTLNETAHLIAKGNGDATNNTGRGGIVELGSNHGNLVFNAGSAIDVSGTTRGGDVSLRALRNANNDGVAVINSGIAVTGAERVQLAAVKTYNSAVLDGNLLAQMQSNATTFFGDAAHEAQLKNNLGTLGSLDKFHLVPEFEVVSNGNLTVSNAVDFAADADANGVAHAWRFGVNGEAPVLTLRAAGDLNVEQSLSDGIFTYTNVDPFTSALILLESATFQRDVRFLLSTDSASFHLVAGADLTAANPNATGSLGNLNINNGADIVTGSGAISLAAGGNINVGGADSLIATIGNTPYQTYASPFSEDGLPATETLPDTGTFNGIWAFLASNRVLQYPKNGGDVSIAAKGNIDFAKATGFFSDWIERLGGQFTVTSGASAAGEGERTFNLTTWGAMLEHLQQGVVALGGGNIDVNAGGNITNLNAALPSTAKQVGINNQNALEIIRGGNLNVIAGGDILSPRVLVDNGVGMLNAGGKIGATSAGLQAIAVLGDAALTLNARGDVGIDAVINTAAMPQSTNQLADGAGKLISENYFFTYGENSALNLESLNGDVTFENNSQGVLTAIDASLASRAAGKFGSNSSNLERDIFKVYPGKLFAQAAAGNINVESLTLLYPVSDGELNLQAGGNIQSLGSVDVTTSIRQSDTAVAGLPGILNPAAQLDVFSETDTAMKRLYGDTTLISNALLHAATPLHVNDSVASIIDAGGDIQSTGGSILDFRLSEQTRVGARDIIGTNFTIQNNRASDVSEIFSQRDFISPVSFDANGILTVAGGVVRIEGPGRLDMLAGRNINLGAAEGIVSVGNQDNPFLPDSGATLNVLAGINGATALTDPVLLHAFVDNYLNNIGGPSGSYIDWFAQGNYSGDFNKLLGAFTGKQYADRNAALADFSTLSVLTKQAISLEAYRTQRTAQLDNANTKNAYAAAHGFVDTNDYSVNLIDFVSFERFGGDLRTAVTAVTGQTYANNTAAATALALLSAAQQHQIAKAAYNAAPLVTQRELVTEIFFDEIRQGGTENAKSLIAVNGRDSFNRSYAAIASMFPGDKWQGDISLIFSGIRSIDGGDINFFTPGGKVDVGLAGSFKNVPPKESGKLGIIAQRYGNVNGFADGDININQSRIFSLDGGGITLWSTHGNVDAGRGAKTALTIPPPTVTVSPTDGSITLVFPAAVAGSGIQSANNGRLSSLDRGPLVSADDDSTPLNSDGRTGRENFFRSLSPGNTFLFAPNGVVDAGDAGISVSGNLLIAAQQVLGADNINVGGISIGVPTSTAISAGTLSLGNAASSATDAATGSMNDAIKQTAAALAEGNVAFVTVDVIGVGR